MNDDAELLVIETLKREKVPLRPSEIARWSGLTHNASYHALLRLREKRQAFRNASGYWALCEEAST